MASTSAALEYFLGLSLYQYADKPRARGTISALVTAVLADLIAVDVGAGFDLDTAVGAQLDMIGEYLGFSRRIDATIPQDYFAFVDYEDVAITTGFRAYDNALNVGSVFKRYTSTDQALTELSDTEYRALLKFRAIVNQSDSTTKSINRLIWEFFGDEIAVVDNADMTFTYYVKPTLTTIAELALDLNLLPRPMGVSITGVNEVADPLNP